ncbi:MAG: ATP-binding cassette domain-containing protein [Chlamydiales bacterium]
MKEKIVCIKNLTKTYKTQTNKSPYSAIKNINLVINKREIFGMIGPSGAGKTTLIRCLVGLERPTHGVIRIGDAEITLFDHTQIRLARRKIGMIFQNFNLFSSYTVLNNIAYPLLLEGMSYEKRMRKARELLELVGLIDKAHAYPAQISGGERQRVAIARALANNPDILFCDEATSALDPKTTYEILSLLNKLNEELGLTIFLITHEMEVIKQICTHVAVLENGEIIEQGRVADLFAKPQHPMTQRLLQNIHHDLPPNFKKKGAILLRLSFNQKTVGEPIISRLLQKYKVEINILLGGIDILKTEMIGNLIINLSGEQEECSLARNFLESQGVFCDEIH